MNAILGILFLFARVCCFAVSWLKPGAVVIDVGINSVDDATTKKGYF